MTKAKRQSGGFLLALLGSVLCAVAIPASVQAAFETIVESGGVQIGSITFPEAVGSTTEGVTFDLEGFTEADLEAIIMWALDSTGEVVSLNLKAFQGDDPCQSAAEDGPCSNRRLNVSESVLTVGSNSCPPPPPPDQLALCSGLGFARNIAFVPATPVYACEGFKGPLAKGPVQIKRKRLIWLRAKLRDGNGETLTDDDLVAPPVVEVTFEPESEATAAALFPGVGGDGAAFVFFLRQWHLLLKLEEFAEPGTYTVTMASGDPSEYRIDPTCEGQFIR